HHPGHRWSALDGIESILGGPGGGDAALGGEVAGVPQTAGQAVEEVDVEADDDGGSIEAILGLDRLAEGEAGAGEDVVAVQRLPGVPLCLREGPGERLKLIVE